MKSSYSDIEENSPLDKIYIPGQIVFYSESDLVRMTGWSKKTIQRLFDDPQFPAVQHRKRRLIERNDLIRYFSVKRNKNGKQSKLPIALENMTQNQTQINTIALHLDNDFVGRNAASAIVTQLEGKYVIRDEPPPVGKDCNDYLQDMTRQKHSRQMGRE